MDSEDDLDATLTNKGASGAGDTVHEETLIDRQIAAYRVRRSSPRIRDDFFGADDTINDEALYEVMAENYADEEYKD